MKKTFTIFTVLLCAAVYSFAQSISPHVLGANGKVATAGGYSVSYTTGQPASETFTAGSSIITQGFQQPNDVYTGVQTFETPALHVQLYPNPAVNEINLVISSLPNSGTYTVQLVDLLGRILQQPLTTQVTNGQLHYTFNVQSLPSSMYFITIKSSSSNTVHTFKFNKIN